MVSEPKAEKERGYSCYDSMSTGELEQLLRLDFQASEAGGSELDAVLYISSLLAGRNEPAAEDAAWEQFRTKYLPYADGRSLYDFGGGDPGARLRRARIRGLRRAVVLAALLSVCLFGGMAVARAAGVDVFGAVARWTDEIFRFVPASDTSYGGPLPMEDAGIWN